jgi:hypothetical protein
MLKFNMGCGHNRMAGFVNVDASAACEPDEVVDLETTPWPWADDCAETIFFNHSLEHMGADAKVFLAMMAEMYRVAANDCEVVIHVPHPRHDDFIGDPTHVRAITPAMMTLFDREKNDEWKAAGRANTPLSHYTGVDLRLTQTRMRLAPRYQAQLDAGEVSEAQLLELIDERLNVVAEIKMRFRVRKPAGSPAPSA